MYALVNEGARILEEGIAQRASDIDVIYVYGYGFPAYLGGSDVLCRYDWPGRGLQAGVRVCRARPGLVAARAAAQAAGRNGRNLQLAAK